MTSIEFDEMFGDFAVLAKDEDDRIDFVCQGISYSVGKGIQFDEEESVKIFGKEVGSIFIWCSFQLNYESSVNSVEPPNDEKHDRYFEGE